LADEVPVGTLPEMIDGEMELPDELVIGESRHGEEADDEQAEVREARSVRV
jgi:hypothetical protein